MCYLCWWLVRFQCSLPNFACFTSQLGAQVFKRARADDPPAPMIDMVSKRQSNGEPGYRSGHTSTCRYQLGRVQIVGAKRVAE